MSTEDKCDNPICMKRKQGLIESAEKIKAFAKKIVDKY